MNPSYTLQERNIQRKNVLLNLVCYYEPFTLSPSILLLGLLKSMGFLAQQCTTECE